MGCQIAEAIRAGLPRAAITPELRNQLIDQCQHCHCQRIVLTPAEDRDINHPPLRRGMKDDAGNFGSS